MLIKRIFSFFMSLLMSVFGLVSGISDNAKNQIQTVNSVQQLDDNVYMLDFNGDYDIDGLLEQGVSSVTDIVSFVADRSPYDVKDFKIGSDEGGGCSTFEAYTPEGDHTLGRNFDFKEAPCFVLWTHPEGHYASVSVIDTNFMLYGTYIHHYSRLSAIQSLLAPYFCVDGINEKGLAIAVLQIRADATSQIDQTKPDITTTTMIRAVLDTCANVDEAVEFLKSHNMHDSLFCAYHYQIIDKDRSVVAEYINNELHIYEENSTDYSVNGSIYEDDDISYQYVTNYSVTKDIGSYEIEQHGEDRAEAIAQVLKEKNGVLTEAQSMDLLSFVKLNYQHPKYPWKIVALWSAVYNSDKCTLKLAANTDYSKVYTFSVDKPCRVLSTEDISVSEYTLREWNYL